MRHKSVLHALVLVMGMKGANMRDMKGLKLLRGLDEDERGDIPVGTILIVGVIVIPLVLILAVWGDKIVKYVDKKITDLIEGGKEPKI
jgi:hypothetical protein